MITANASVSTPVTAAASAGNNVMAQTPSVGPSGEIASRSKVPATSSVRIVFGTTASVAVREWRMTRPTTTNAKYASAVGNRAVPTRRDT